MDEERNDNAPRPNLAVVARDVAEGRVFGSWMIREDGMLGSVFMPVMFGDTGTFKGVAHVYEYMDKAEPCSINGYPIFFECHTLLVGEMPLFRKLLDKAILRSRREREFARIDGSGVSWWERLIGKSAWWAGRFVAHVKSAWWAAVQLARLGK
jgi:hypothetical protein